MNESKEKNIIKPIIQGIFKFLVALAGLAAAVVAAFWGGNQYAVHQNIQQNSEITVQINNVLSDGGNTTSVSSDIKSSTENLIDAYESSKQENEDQSKEIDKLNNDVNKLQDETAKLTAENDSLKIRNHNLTDYLLQSGIDIDPDVLDDPNVIVVKPTTKKLKDLPVLESSGYDTKDGIIDYHGDSHSFSYYLHADRIAFVKYKLAKKYDIFEANIITTLADTGDDVKISVEVYIDDEGDPIARVDNINRDTTVAQIGPVSIKNADRMTIKVITLEGDAGRGGGIYISEDSLSVIE